MNRNCGGSTVGVAEKDVTPAGPVHGEASSFERPGPVLFLWGVEGASYRDLLNAYQFKRAGRVAILFEAQRDDLAYVLHQGIEAFGLRVASAKGGDGSNEIAVLVFFDHHGEFSTRPHAPPRVLTLSRYAIANIP
jgi:hypothetical protein